MKNLYIIRHAKSSWDVPLPDIERPITKRGEMDSHLMGDELAKDLTFQMAVFVSNSQRTKDTYSIIKTYLHHLIKNEEFTDELYVFDRSNLLKFIVNLPNSHNSVLIFGHNFAITDFVNSYGSKIIDNVSTCGFVHLTFDIDHWQDIKKGKTQKVLFPKNLK